MVAEVGQAGAAEPAAPGPLLQFLERDAVLHAPRHLVEGQLGALAARHGAAAAALIPREGDVFSHPLIIMKLIFNFKPPDRTVPGAATRARR